MPSVDVNAVMICDDVRHEINGKQILIGAYGGGIIVPSFPAMIPLAIWMEIQPPKIGLMELDIRLKVPGPTPEFRMRIGIEVQRMEDPTAIATPQVLCPIAEAGLIEVSLKFVEAEEWQVVKTRRILEGTASSAPPLEFRKGSPPPPAKDASSALLPPGEQSPPVAQETKPVRAQRRRRYRPI